MTIAQVRNRARAALFAAVTLQAVLVPTFACAADPVFKDSGLALSGHDPVAYFSKGAPTRGRAEIETEWKGARWRFANLENRELFVAAPEKYAPQYGGYCAWAVSKGYTAPADPLAWDVVDGKLYLNYDKDVQVEWRKVRAAAIESANRNWPGVLDKK